MPLVTQYIRSCFALECSHILFVIVFVVPTPYAVPYKINYRVTTCQYNIVSTVISVTTQVKGQFNVKCYPFLLWISQV